MPENTGNISVFLCFPLIIRFMGTIIIPKTQIDHQRPVHLQCLSHQIVDPLDQFRCPGKRILLWNSHFHNQEITFIGNASVHTTGSPSVSGCDSKHSSPVSADIHRRNKGLPWFSPSASASSISSFVYSVPAPYPAGGFPGIP